MTELLRSSSLDVDPTAAREYVLGLHPDLYRPAHEEVFGPWVVGAKRLVLGEFILSDAELAMTELELLTKMSDELWEEMGPIERTRYRQRVLEREVVAKFGFGAVGVRDLGSIEPVKWIVDDLLAYDSLAMLYGPSGVGKSFLAIDFAMSISMCFAPTVTGGDIWGDPVAYIAAEGIHGFQQRVAAWKRYRVAFASTDHDIPADAMMSAFPVVVVPASVNLGDELAVERFAESCAQAKVKFVVIDTLARCTAGLDENSAKEMGLVVASLDRIRQATGACVLVIHHSGKNGSAGARGSSVLRAAMDTELCLDGSPSSLRLTVTKQKDGREADPVKLHIRTVDLPDASPDVHTSSAVISPGHAGEDLIVGGAQATLEALRSIADEGGVSSSDWQEATKIRRSTFQAHRKTLVDASLVENVGTTSRPKYRVA